MRMVGWFIFMMLGFAANAATLTSLVVHNDPNGTASVHCTFSGAMRYHQSVLTHPDRVVIDIPEASSRLNVARAVNTRGLIARVRAGKPTPHSLRLVFDVTRPVKFTVRATSASALQFVLTPHANHVKTSSSAPDVKPRHTTSTVTPRMVHRVPTQSMRDVVIVLDPGHGGHDPGAIGPEHRAEKNVVLAIAKMLKQRIDKQPGMRAVLTRDGDYYVGLRERLMIARKHNADVFISIHADAFINAHSHGASVFALSPRGATSEAARWLAEKENYSELGGVNLKGLDDKNGMIRSVLLDLSQTATVSASLQMGTQVLNDLGRMTTLHNRRVEQARFVVLKSPDIPSILVETGFISNPQEAKNLSTPGYQARLTQAIVNGLQRYFWSNPPHGTRLEAMSNARNPTWSFTRTRHARDAVA